ncbi:cupin domain-containing protein [Dactylosporangium sp. AC04546]|uniref:cupin domain-containing protein n=1 Tax=Dactylosporangium sp. AC04546 TaxID=2862460 RepID=UPI001EDFA491|nr:cupin domain-containing protein [Dactylosporangium sp. AC04546]WVK88733.1 cupin domain-containing protein [Dactylosporangium sp. AC04546]
MRSRAGVDGEPALTVEASLNVVRTRAGTPGSPSWYHGVVWIEQHPGGAEPGGLLASGAHFSPGARTAWHRCDHEQVIRVLHGTGRVQRRGGQLHVIHTDDVIVVPAGEWHWHGAAPGAALSVHTVRQAGDPETATEWGAQVTDAEYLRPPISIYLPHQTVDRTPDREPTW